MDIETLFNYIGTFSFQLHFLSFTCSTLIVDCGPPDRPIAVLGAGGRLLSAAVAEDCARGTSVAVVDFGKGLNRARSKQEWAGAVICE